MSDEPIQIQGELIGVPEKRSCINYGEAFGLPSGTVRGVIALMLTGTLCYMVIHNVPVPDNYSLLVGGVVGAYFTDKILNRKNNNGETK